MKKILFVLFATLFFLGCSSKQQSSKQPVIVTSTYALYDVASFVAGDYFDVKLLLQPGMEVHSFEPTPKDVALLHQSKLFLYNGAGLEPWVEHFSKGIKSVDMSRYVTLIKPLSHHYHYTNHHHHDTDPHYWLDVTNMQKVADVIASQYASIFPQYKTFFQSQAKQYKAKLTQLDKSYKNGLKSCNKDTIFVNHNAYSYLGKRYGFLIDSLVGLSPEAKPSPREVQALIQEIKQEEIHIVFGESFENNSVVKMIAKDTNVVFEILQPLANLTKEEYQAKKDYFTIMRENLSKLQAALECR